MYTLDIPNAINGYKVLQQIKIGVYINTKLKN
jgi:hypothetical protein